MQETHVAQYAGDLQGLKSLLVASGTGHPVESPNQAVWQLKADEGVLTAYHTGKIVVQGKDRAWLDRVRSMLQQKPSSSHGAFEEESASFSPHIGVDEAGKGDFFGPLVVGAVFVESSKMASELRARGVRDSKELTDNASKEVAAAIRDLCPHHRVVILQPFEYNSRYRSVRNANILLAQLHAQSIEETLNDIPHGVCRSVVIDQFSKREERVIDELLENGRKLSFAQMHKGERDVAVAAASILARDGFLAELGALSQRYHMSFPKGASHVIAAGKDFVRLHGVDKLDDVAKTSFRTALSVTSTFDI
jgi:ribonuclease HIII